MYCRYCGKQVPDGSVFCTFCGRQISMPPIASTHSDSPLDDALQNQASPTPLPHSQAQKDRTAESSVQPPAENAATYTMQAPPSRRPKNMTWLILAGLLAAAVLLGSAVFYFQYQSRSWDNWLEDYRAELDGYYLSDEEQQTLNHYLLEANHNGNKEQPALKQQLLDLKDQVIKENESYSQQIDAGLNSLDKDYDLTYAFDDELTQIEDYKAQIRSLAEKKNYPDALAQIEACKKLMAPIQQIETGWNVSVVQKDISQYPQVKLYLEVTDQSGNPIENLDQKIFFLSAKDASSGSYMKKAITQAVQLNENENININLVADVSASMTDNLYAVQGILNNFLSTVQFGVGDQVALTQFNDTSYVTQPFTTDKNSILSQVNNLYASGDTKLYDTLIESILNVAGQSGAKCVIAFTDGYDNRSASAPQDVVRVAQNCGIPVFIIGIGYDVDHDTLTQIAQSSGGYYTNITSVSTMQDIYNSIYTKQKQTYCLAYTADDDNMMSLQDLSIYLRGDKGGGQATCSFKASDDFFDILLNHFQNSYIDALSAGDPSIMAKAGYVNTNGGVYAETKAFIEKNKTKLAEQLLQAEVNDVKYIDANTYEITSTEIFDIQQLKDYDTEVATDSSSEMQTARNLLAGNYFPDQLAHQQIAVHKERTLGGHYLVKKSSEGRWQISDFSQKYDILGTNVYTAYIYY